MGRKRKPDGRAVHGTRTAIESALKDEARDARLIQQFNEGQNYTQIGESLGLSRQRATELVHRAIIRKAMLLEHRNGKSVDRLTVDWNNMYPGKKYEAARRKARITIEVGSRPHDQRYGQGGGVGDDVPDLSDEEAGQAAQDHSEEVGQVDA